MAFQLFELFTPHLQGKTVENSIYKDRMARIGGSSSSSDFILLGKDHRQMCLLQGQPRQTTHGRNHGRFKEREKTERERERHKETKRGRKATKQDHNYKLDIRHNQTEEAYMAS